MNNVDKKIEDMVFSIFDTETTGDNKFLNDKPVEVAVVNWNLKKGFLGKPKSWLIDPKMIIHPSAKAVHEISDEMVKGKPLLEDILPEFHNYIEDSALIAHNIEFDLEMLPSLKERSNLKLDCLRFARKIYKIGDLGYKNQDLRSHKSQELRYWLNIKVDTMGLKAHRAAADILVTGEVFSEILKKFLIQTKSTYMSELSTFINSPMLIDKMTFGKFNGEKLEDCIAKECSKKNNYFFWLLKELKSERMNISADLKYSIEYYLKQNDIDLIGLFIDTPQKNWNNIAKMVNK